MPRYKQNSESFERKFMQKLAHKVSSLVQNFPIPGHNWKLDMDRAQKKYFRYFFSPSPLRLLWGWYHDLQSKYIGPEAFSQFQTSSSKFYRATTFFLPSKRVTTAFMSTFYLFAGFQWREGRQFRVDFIPNCLLLFTWDALISKYHQIWSQPSLFSLPPSRSRNNCGNG